MLCTLNQLKSRLKIDPADTTDDLAMTGLIQGVSARMASSEGAGRELELTTITEIFCQDDARSTMLWTRAWPVVSVTSILEAMWGAFDSATGLIEAGPGVSAPDFYVNHETGRITRVALMWFCRPFEQQVIYQGGWTACEYWQSGNSYAAGYLVQTAGNVYQAAQATSGILVPGADPTNWTLLTGQVPAPGELVEWCIAQSINDWQRRDRPGMSSEGASGASASQFGPYGLLPGVAAALKGGRYRRIM